AVKWATIRPAFFQQQSNGTQADAQIIQVVAHANPSNNPAIRASTQKTSARQQQTQIVAMPTSRTLTPKPICLFVRLAKIRWQRSIQTASGRSKQGSSVRLRLHQATTHGSLLNLAMAPRTATHWWPQFEPKHPSSSTPFVSNPIPKSWPAAHERGQVIRPIAQLIQAAPRSPKSRFARSQK
ncbi:hypothetical protein ACLOJK_024064, partial [Asimina triloba]